MLKPTLSNTIFLILYLGLAVIVSSGLILFDWSTSPLLLLVIPILYAVLVYPVYVYRALCFISLIISIFVIVIASRNILSSLAILITVATVVVLFGEVIHFVINKYRNNLEFTTQVIDTMAQGLTLADNEGKFKLVNQAYARMLGYSIQELIGKSAFDLTHPDELKDLGETRQRRLAGETSSYEVRIRKQDNSYLSASITGTPFYEKEVVVGMLATYTDLTERKRFEENLRQGEKLYRSLVEQLPFVTYIFVNTPKPKVTYVSPQSTQLLGLPPEDCMAEPLLWYTHLHPDDKPIMINSYAESSKQLSMFQMEYRFIRPDGRTLWIRDTATPILDENNQLLFYQGVAEDITTEKKTVEEQLIAGKLESLGQLAGGIAHDFNNLLTAVLGSLALIKLTVPNDTEIVEYVENAETASLRARDLTKQLLTFAKGGTPVKQVSDLRQLLKEVVQPILNGATVQPHFEITPDLWFCEVDSGQISRVIQNLVTNAVQAMPEGGTLLIKAENLTLAEKAVATLKADNYVKISLKDEGVGIKSENLALIFDPYFTTKPTAVGLGLAVCYSIIKQHNGIIEVESKVGQGATFHIYLPAKIGVSLISPVPVIPPAYKKRILIMDDDTMIRKSLRSLLNRLGYNVEEAANGAEAISMYQNALNNAQKFDVIIMDLTVPDGMGGKEATRRILEIEPTAAIIVSSGYSDDPIMSNYQEYGFIDVLPKPYNLKNLIASLDRIMQSTN
jgi:two-component system, cell cycle sensor histidine kinase and response regulator CckA